MTLTILAFVSLVFAAIPAYVFFRNFSQFERLPGPREVSKLAAISVLIPARNEAQSIGPCIESVLASHDVKLEVVVLDDQSEDRTAEVILDYAERDKRVRLESSAGLPAGWCGKQHACSQLAEFATHDVFVFIDADVRLAPDALVRMSSRLRSTDVDLLSGFPRQITGTVSEKLLIPLIHFVLLGFLSLRRMRESKHPAFGAGCGQLFMTERQAYQHSGGHGAIRKSLHDGLKLPRVFRSQGLVTDVFDASDLATCRMYRNVGEVWYGLKKNATEGVASAGLIVPVTLMLLVGQVSPFVLLCVCLANNVSSFVAVTTLLACLIAWLPRFISAFRYRQSYFGAILHPLAIVAFLCIQWAAFIGSFSQKPVAWKGRPYPAA